MIQWTKSTHVGSNFHGEIHFLMDFGQFMGQVVTKHCEGVGCYLWANPGDVFGHALTVNRQQASNLGPGVADIQVAHYHTSRHITPLVPLLVADSD